jgi:hypothetical protein
MGFKLSTYATWWIKQAISRGTRRAGPHDPPSRPRCRPGPQGDEDSAPARAEAQSRSLARGDRGGDRPDAGTRAGAARARSSTRQPRHPIGEGDSSVADLIPTRPPNSPSIETPIALARPSSWTPWRSSSRASAASSSSDSASTACDRARSRRSARISASRASASASSRRGRYVSSARSRPGSSSSPLVALRRFGARASGDVDRLHLAERREAAKRLELDLTDALARQAQTASDLPSPTTRVLWRGAQ